MQYAESRRHSGQKQYTANQEFPDCINFHQRKNNESHSCKHQKFRRLITGTDTPGEGETTGQDPYIFPPQSQNHTKQKQCHKNQHAIFPGYVHRTIGQNRVEWSKESGSHSCFTAVKKEFADQVKKRDQENPGKKIQ